MQTPPRGSESQRKESTSFVNSPTIVGIGASAGGLAALQAFFEALPADPGMSFVVIVHLDPERESSVAELLQAKTDMPVTQVREATALAPNHVYVIPPSKRLAVTDGVLSVSDFSEPRGRRAPIDHFFRSLARGRGDRMGIILSGRGTDGAVGVRAIKEAGGLVLAQDPEETEQDSMPQSVIATGLVDRVLPARGMARELVEMLRPPAELPEDPSALSKGQAETLRQILVRLHTRTGHDFSEYKRSTVLRRIQRRMQVSRNDRLEDYLSILHERADEAQALFKELLIGVTTFFRDSEPFEALKETVIPTLFEGKMADDTVRVWTCGCSTGEEAYSVAMLMQEHAAIVDNAPQIQIFASDLDEDALAAARQGRYPMSIEADLSDERLQRFFNRGGNHYRIKRSLRESVVFAPHNVLRDPPFTRIDLITCRNLLIYLQRERQRQIFEIFHYALRDRGYLFLGQAETPDASNLFRPFDKERGLYRARERTTDIGRLPTLLHADVSEVPHRPRRLGQRRDRPSEEDLHRRSLEEYAPPSALVDKQYNIVHLSERAGRYLRHPKGTITSELTRLIHPELQMELRSALFQAFEKGAPTVARPVQVGLDGQPRTIYLTVRPSRGRGGDERLALVIFNEGEAMAGPPFAKDGTSRTENSTVQQLEEELRHARKQLQATQEEYESSQEELKAQNEELRSMNEEYKSATEELETSRQELQSVNEELETVNTELQNKLEEVSRAHSDLQNLMAATDVGTLFLDRELCIKRFTPQVEDYFNVRESDVGRPIGELRRRFDYDRLERDANEVLSGLVPVEHEVRGAEGRWYLVRIRPYRTVEDKIDGVVITFVDVTELKQTEAELRAAKEYAEMIVDTVREGLLVLDEELRVQSASASFYEKFQVEPAETEGQLIYELDGHQWDIPQLREILEDTRPENETFRGVEITQTFEDVGKRTMLLSVRRLDAHQLILLSIEDITKRKQAREALQELNETLEERVEMRTEQLRWERERLQSLLDSIVDEVWFCDADGRISLVNPAVLEGLGFDSAGEVHRALSEVLAELELYKPGGTPLREDDTPLLRSLEGAVIKGEEEVLIHPRTGERRYRQVTSAPLRAASGEVTGAVAAVRDITELKQTERRLRDLNETLEERVERRTTQVRELASRLTMAEQKERRRLALVLHDDLQQRLYGIQMRMTFLRNHAEADEQEQLLEKIRQAEALMNEAIATARQLSVDLSPPVLKKDGLVDALGWLRTQMKELHGLEVDIKAAHPFHIPHEDMRVLLFQVTRELLFNVAKHAETGRATVELRDAEDEVVICVTDEGRGFDPGAVEFDGQGTTGFGLIAARERLELFGGRLKIDATPGEGTCVTAHAPLESARHALSNVHASDEE